MNFPEKFCKEYALYKGNVVQLVIFMATVLKVKPIMDDWIDNKSFGKFKKICAKYNLHVKPNAILTNIYNPSLEKDSIGGKNLTTTKATGHSPQDKNARGSLHVFISSSKSSLEEGFQNGWYPLVIHNRVINKPYIDSINFGYNLGYPECCIKFFQKYNDWRYFSHLYEIFKNTKGKPSFLVNPLTRVNSLSYVSYMPCSFSCPNAINMSKKLRALIYKKEPSYTKDIDKSLKKSFLVFYENICYGFDGDLIKKRLFYKKVYFFGGDNHQNIYQKEIEKGNNLFIRNKEVFIFENKQLRSKISVAQNQEKPMIPFLIKFE